MSEPPSTGGEAGAFIENVYISRTVRIAPIFEHELNTISSSSAGSAIWFSLMSAFLSVGAGILINAAFQEKLTELAVLTTWWIGPGCILASLICFGFAINATLKGNAIMKDLRSKLGTN